MNRKIFLYLAAMCFICILVDMIEASPPLLIGEEEDMGLLNRTRRSYSQPGRRLNPRKIRQQNNCKKVDFNVNFGELGWEKFIIYPKVMQSFLISAWNNFIHKVSFHFI